MTAYCYSCLSFAFRFSPFMDKSVASSTCLTPSTQKDVPSKQREMKKRFGLGFLLLECSKTRTSQLLPHKQIFFLLFSFFIHSCFPVNVLAYFMPEDPTTDVITRPMSFSFVYIRRVALFTGSWLFCVSVVQDYSWVDIEYRALIDDCLTTPWISVLNFSGDCIAQAWLWCSCLNDRKFTSEYFWHPVEIMAWHLSVFVSKKWVRSITQWAASLSTAYMRTFLPRQHPNR